MRTVIAVLGLACALLAYSLWTEGAKRRDAEAIAIGLAHELAANQAANVANGDMAQAAKHLFAECLPKRSTLAFGFDEAGRVVVVRGLCIEPPTSL